MRGRAVIKHTLSLGTVPVDITFDRGSEFKEVVINDNSEARRYTGSLGNENE